MHRIAHIFSNVLSPLLIPTYGAAASLCLSQLSALSPALRANVVMMTFLITAALPAVAILLLYKMKVISDPGLNKRRERFIPYGITILCYGAETLYLAQIHAPMWMWMFMAGGAAAALICIVVNTVWKISAHMAAMAGLTALLFRLQQSHLSAFPLWWWITAAILLTGLLGSSRLLLERHTFWQVIAGTATGFCCVYFLTMI